MKLQIWSFLHQFSPAEVTSEAKPIKAREQMLCSNPFLTWGERKKQDLKKYAVNCQNAGKDLVLQVMVITKF